MMTSPERSSNSEPILRTRKEVIQDALTLATSPSVGRLLYTIGGGAFIHRAYDTYEGLVEPLIWGFNPPELSQFSVMKRQARMGDLKQGNFIRWGDSMALGDDGGITKYIVEKITQAEPESTWNSIDGYARSGTTTGEVLDTFYNPKKLESVVSNLRGIPNINIGFSAAGNNLLELLSNERIQALVTRVIDTMPTRKSDLRRPETLKWYSATLGTLSEFKRVTTEVKKDTRKILHGFAELKGRGVDVQTIFMHSLLNEQYAQKVKVIREGIEDDIKIFGDPNKERAAKIVTAHINAAVAEAASTVSDMNGIQIVGVDFFNGIPVPEMSNIHPSRKTQALMADIVLKHCISPKGNENLFDYLTNKLKELRK